MYISNAEKLTKILICPKCKSHIVRNDNGHGVKRMQAHIDKCDGTFKKNYIAEKVSLPYCPHILDNPVYEYCLAYGLQWKPLQYYMTYDFETMEQAVNECVSDSTIINSRLKPVSVSYHVKSESINLTKHFTANDTEFIPHWLESMFDVAKLVVKDKYKFYESMMHVKEDKVKEIVKDINVVTVLVFNSSRFDSNLFKQYFNYGFWHIDNNSLIGTASSLKQFILVSKEVSLRFIDAQAFVAGGTLKQFGMDFGGIDNSAKGEFPYEAINTDNFNEVLMKSEPFAYEDFYSQLHQQYLINEEEYNEYVIDAQRFKSRWDYLLAYNDNDVEMMIKPIDALIELNAKNHIDMLSNLSLSKNSNSANYEPNYRNFDPNIDYGIMNKVNTFKPTLKWWSYKCRNYEYQDDEFNKKHPKSPQRNVSKCVSDKDFDEFMKMYNDPDKGKCQLCREHFTDSNRPTLDRIDNDIGHELSNCLLACAECNTLRKRDDEKVTRLRIQLIKYCRLNHLNTTNSNRDEFHEFRRGMVGGLSMVLHRDNRRGITKINRLKYDEVNNKVISYDTQNIVTNVMGTDANSLYPSVRSSNYHPFIKYHGHRMYMEGSLTNFYKCYNKDETRNDKVYGICYDIIHSKNRFKTNPKSVFRATVKLECPRCKINDFIECAPVWRNLEIENKESVIGSYMYNYGKTNKISSIDKVDTKLTMTLDTMNKFECFGCYELWWFIDHGIVVTDILNLAIYEANTCCHTFVNECMSERQAILSGQKHGNEKFYKISMNGS